MKVIEILEKLESDNSRLFKEALLREHKDNETPLEYMQNHAEPGPNNLARHSVGIGCDAHGEGTWDLIMGNFS